MKPENMVCSLEMSKKLVEKGIKLETYFVWYKKFMDKDNWALGSRDEGAGFEIIPAPLAEEIELPGMVDNEVRKYHIEIEYRAGGWIVRYCGGTDDYGFKDLLISFQGESLAEAKALMKIFIFENGLEQNLTGGK